MPALSSGHLGCVCLQPDCGGNKRGAVGGSWRGLNRNFRVLTGHKNWLASDGNWIQWWAL